MTSPASRIAIIVATSGLLLAVLLWSGGRWEPSSVAATGRASRVLIVGMPGLAWDEVGTGRLPNLDRLIANGALGAMTVRTLSQRPTTVEAYASLGAGARVRAEGAGAEAAGPDGGPIGVT
nr:hypothetical protein [Actinomycetota bacterium]